MPIARVKVLESPTNSLTRKTLKQVIVFKDIKVVVIIREGGMLERPEGDQGAPANDQANQNGLVSF